MELSTDPRKFIEMKLRELILFIVTLPIWLSLAVIFYCVITAWKLANDFRED